MVEFKRVTHVATEEFLDSFYPNVIEPRVRDIFERTGNDNVEDIADDIIENSPDNTKNGLRKLLYEYGLLSKIQETINELKGVIEEEKPTEEISAEGVEEIQRELDDIEEHERQLKEELEQTVDEDAKREIEHQLSDLRERRTERRRERERVSKPTEKIEGIPTVEIPKEPKAETPIEEPESLTVSINNRIREIESHVESVSRPPPSPEVLDQRGLAPEETSRKVEQRVEQIGTQAKERTGVRLIVEGVRNITQGVGNVARGLIRRIFGG